jgi:glycosyltransferase involved in cell wall biosynthesis
VIERTPLTEASAVWDHLDPEVVIFGIVPWSPRWQRPHHFAVELVRRGHRVVYVTPHLLTGHAPWREVPDVARPDGVVLTQLATEHLDSIHWMAAWSHDDLAHAHHEFWQMVRELRLRCPILLIQSPRWWPLIQWIRERSEFPVIYDCLDEHTGWDPDNAEQVREWEDQLAGGADLVLTSARHLYERLRERTSQIVLVPNGCDVATFTSCSTPNGVLRGVVDGPIVGYYGAISPGWADTSLLASIAELRPDWNIVVIGPCEEACAVELDACPNVLRLDEVSYQDLPRYCADFDVAVIPFLVNELTRATDPVKLYEYFAAGKPVVATPMPELYQFQGRLTIATDARGFVDAIERYLRSPGDAPARQAIAANASWSSRVDTFYERMLTCLPSMDVVIVPGYGDPAATRASAERDPSWRLASVRVIDGVDGVLGHAASAEASRYLVVLPAGVELPAGGLLAFAGALTRTPGAAVVIGEVAAGTGGNLRELAWSRFATTYDVDPAATVGAPLAMRRHGPDRPAVTADGDCSLAARLQELGRVVRCPDLLVASAPAHQDDGLDAALRRALNRRAVNG